MYHYLCDEERMLAICVIKYTLQSKSDSITALWVKVVGCARNGAKSTNWSTKGSMSYHILMLNFKNDNTVWQMKEQKKSTSWWKAFTLHQKLAKCVKNIISKPIVGHFSSRTELLVVVPVNQRKAVIKYIYLGDVCTDFSHIWYNDQL